MALGYVRPADPDDAGEIARIQLATWRHAYRRILPRHVLDGLDEGWMAQRWLSSIEAPPTPRHRVLVAIEQAERPSTAQQSSAAPRSSAPSGSYLVGFAATGVADETALAPEEDEGAVLGPTVAAIMDLVVEPRWGRRGHGSRLLAASVDWWREDGFTTALAWAFEADTATQAFLHSAGWEPDGATRALDVDDLLVPQLRLHTDLTVDPDDPGERVG